MLDFLSPPRHQDGARQTTISWAAKTGGNFGSINNWSPPRRPGPGDHAYIGPLPAGEIVHINGGQFMLASLVSEHDLVLAAGVLEVASTSTLTVFTMLGGTLGGEGDVIVSGALRLSGGTMTGPGRTVAIDALAIGGRSGFGTTLDAGRTLENRGAGVWENGEIALNHSAQRAAGRIVNAAGASFEMRAPGQTMRALRFSNEDDGNDALFLNLGTVIHSSTQGAGISAPFDNRGTLEVAAGRLRLGTRGMLGGTINVAADATLFIGAPGYLAQGPSFRHCPGRIEVGGSLELAGELTTSGTLELSGGTVHADSAITVASYRQRDGRLAGSGDLHASAELVWASGQMLGPGRSISAGTMTLGSARDVRIGDGRVLENRGTAVWASGDIFLTALGGSGTGRMINAQGASFDMRAPVGSIRAPTLDQPGPGATALFDNAGLLTLSVDRPVGIAVRFHNRGTLVVGTGTLAFSAGGVLDGAIAIALDAAILVPAARLLVAGPALRDCPGILHLRGGSVVLSGEVAGLGTLLLEAGALDADSAVATAVYRQSGGVLGGEGELHAVSELAWTGGLMTGAGRTVSSGRLALSGNYLGLGGGRWLENRGAAIFNDVNLDVNSGLGGPAGGVLNAAGGTLALRGAGGHIFELAGPDGGGNASRFANFGLLSIETRGEVRIATRLVNMGALDVASAPLTLQGGGAVLGNIDIAATASIAFAGGSFLVSGASLVNASGAVRVTGGSVELEGALDVPTLELDEGEIICASGIAAVEYRQRGGTLGGAGDLRVSGRLAWSGGVMTGAGQTISNGYLEIASGGRVGLDGGRVLENRASGAWEAGYVDLNSGVGKGSGRLTNAQGASLVIGARGGAVQAFATNQGDGEEGGDALFDNAGTLVLEGRSSLTLAVRFENYGMLELRSGRLNAYLAGPNAGTIALGSTAVLDITGDVENLAGGHLRFDVASQAQAGFLSVSGTAILAGTIGINPVSPYVPGLGERFALIGFAARSGVFEAIDPLSPKDGLVYEVDYSAANRVHVTVVEQREPPEASG